VSEAAELRARADELLARARKVTDPALADRLKAAASDCLARAAELEALSGVARQNPDPQEHQ
jgi:hypothetical protein